MSQISDIPEINLTKPTQEFKRFLEDKENRRIIFSGAFGSGKTYFLKRFFEEDKQFCYIRLAPVNYSVAQTEDVFELVKFDILFQILERGALPKDLDFSKTDLLRHLSLLLDPEKGLRGILEKTSQTGHGLFDPTFDNLVKILHEPQPSAGAEDASGLEKLRGFLKKHTRKTGSPYEQDTISQLIFALIAVLGEANKETVLVIDDLDRIDPEHIFRILNVFAAHFDIDENENKFGFDRIILVCDIQNVRRIFRNRYGQDTDFSGYIDKFYSRRVFAFDNRKAVGNVIGDVLSSLKITFSPEVVEAVTNHQTNSHKWVLYVLHGMVQSGCLNLRSIWRMQNKNFHYQPQDIRSGFGYCSSIGLFHLLSTFNGDIEALKDALKHCISREIWKECLDESDRSNQNKLAYILPILTRFQYVEEGKDNTFCLYEGETKISYRMVMSGQKNDLFARINASPSSSVIDIFQYLLKAVEILEQMNLLH